MAHHHLEQDVAAQGKPGHGGGADVERAEEGRHVVGHHLDGDGAAGVRRPPHAAHVGSQNPVASLQRFDLRRPDGVIQRKPVKEQERRPASRFLIGDIDSVYGYGFHGALPSCLNRLQKAELFLEAKILAHERCRRNARRGLRRGNPITRFEVMMSGASRLTGRLR